MLSEELRRATSCHDNNKQLTEVAFESFARHLVLSSFQKSQT